MNLQIRHPKARSLAIRLATLRNSTMTDAVVAALEAELKRAEEADDGYLERIRVIQRKLAAKRKPGGRDLTKDEIDALWTDAV